MNVLAYPAFRNRAANPYNHLLYSHLLEQDTVVYEFALRNLFCRKYDVVHVHWPEGPIIGKKIGFAIIIAGFFQLCLIFLKIRGSRIVWTVHNINPHESKYRWFDSFRMKMFVHVVDGFICMTEDSLKTVMEEFTCLKKKQFKIIKHGTYRGYYINTIEKSDARALLAIPSNRKVVLFFGMIRKYKGLEELLQVFAVPGNELVLVIAGRIAEDENYFLELFQLYSANNIITRFEYIEDKDVQVFFNAADLVVLPYRSILNSGSVLLALSFDRPVITRRNSSMLELVREFGNSTINTYQNLTLDFINESMETMGIDGEVDMDDRKWERIAFETKTFYQMAIGRSKIS